MEPWEFYAAHQQDYESMETWPLGMFKLAMRFAKDYAKADEPFGPDWVKRKVEENERGFGRKS